jgi:hypothetical protein
MTSRWTRVVLAALVAWTIAGTAVAYAHSSYPNTVNGALTDCSNNDPLKGHYSLKVLQAALKQVKAQALQYTGCADALTAAIQAQSAGSPPPSGTPERGKVTRPSAPVYVRNGQKAIKSKVNHLQHEGGSSLTLPTGQTVTPGSVGARSASFLSSLPTPLLIALAALLAAVAAVGARALQTVVRARRSR